MDETYLQLATLFGTDATISVIVSLIDDVDDELEKTTNEEDVKLLKGIKCFLEAKRAERQLYLRNKTN